jgi:hypothetical protein
MEVSWVWFLVVGVGGLTVVFYRLYRKLVSRAQAHQRAMIGIAGQFDLALVMEDDSKVSMKLSGVVEGIPVTLFSGLKQRVGGLAPITQVTVICDNPKHTEIHLVEDGFVEDEVILRSLIERAVKDALEQS